MMPPKAAFIEALEAERNRFAEAGEEDKAGAFHDAAFLESFETDPEFYVDLFWRYAEEGMIPKPAAAIGALYSSLVSHDRTPIEAMFEGYDFTLSKDARGMVAVPGWIVLELLTGFARYMTDNEKDLNAAFDISKGRKGSKKICAPLNDLNVTQMATYLRVRDIGRGGSGAKSKAAAEIEEWAMRQSANGDSTAGLEERTVRKAWANIRRAFIERDLRNRGER